METVCALPFLSNLTPASPFALQSSHRLGMALANVRSESPSQKIRGEVVMKGEVLNIDRDGFYIVKEPNGREVHLLVAEDLNVGLHVGDQVLAQVAPDGYVTTISKASDDQSESAPIYSGGYFDDGLYDDDWYFDYYELQAVSGSRRSNQERLREYEAGQMYEEAEESGIFNF